MSSALDPRYYLQKNPQLPQHPLGAYTDSMYEAQAAQLRQEIQQRYADILQQLGYVDPKTGQFIKGLVELGADRQRADLGNSLQLARQGVDQEAQRDSNYFSGYHATQIGQAEHPFVTALANLDVDEPQQLHTLWEHAGDLLNEYNVRNNVLLAEAAGRFVPPDDGSGDGGGGGTGSVDVGDPYGGDVVGRILGGGRLGTTTHARDVLTGAISGLRGSGIPPINKPPTVPMPNYGDVLKKLRGTFGGV